ncbi:protein of unknown function [Burkholderia multivorans]
MVCGKVARAWLVAQRADHADRDGRPCARRQCHDEFRRPAAASSVGSRSRRPQGSLYLRLPRSDRECPGARHRTCAHAAHHTFPSRAGCRVRIRRASVPPGGRRRRVLHRSPFLPSQASLLCRRRAENDAVQARIRGAAELLPFCARRAGQGTGRPANYRPASVQGEKSACRRICAAWRDQTDGRGRVSAHAGGLGVTGDRTANHRSDRGRTPSRSSGCPGIIRWRAPRRLVIYAEARSSRPTSRPGRRGVAMAARRGGSRARTAPPSLLRSNAPPVLKDYSALDIFTAGLSGQGGSVHTINKAITLM